MAEIGSVYAAGRERISRMVAPLDPDQDKTRVPACPEWTVHDVVAHLTGICADILAGNLEGVATDPWTAEQVRERREWAIAEVVAEWDEVAPQVEAMTGAFPPEAAKQWVADLTIHEHDVRGALNQPGARDSEGVAMGLEFAVTAFLDASLKSEKLPPLQVRAGDREWVAGGDEPKATVQGPPFEMFRALSGRRSRNQIKAFDWSDNPDIYLPAFQFGPFNPPASDLDE
jgi:uncharacterized protein (TIGR03083 family)